MTLLTAWLIALLIQSAAAAGSVTGTITDAATRAPVPHAQILLARIDGSLAVQSIPLKADAQGRFISAAVPPGTYRVFAEDPDYVRREHLTSIAVASGQSLTIAIALTRRGVITGRVMTEHGDPAPTIYVRAWRGAEVVAETRTNDLGEYRLFGLTPGSYVVGAERYPGPTIGRTSPIAFSERLAQALGGTDRYWVRTPPCPDCKGEGVGSQAISALLSVGSFLDPRALTGRTYPAVYFPATIDHATAIAIDVAPGAEVAGIDLRLIVK